MALWTRKDLKERFDIKDSTIRVYLSRGTLVANDDGYIDDSIDKNAKTIKRLADKAEKGDQGQKKKQKKQSDKIPEPEETEAPAAAPSGGGSDDLDTREKLAAIRRKEEQTRLDEIKRRKLEGELIPVDAVEKLFAQHFHNFTSSFTQAVDNIVEEMAGKKDFTAKEKAEVRERITEIVNEASRDGVETSKKDIDTIVDEYSEKRGRGEKKES